jgi:hypothetical protein
MRRQRSGAIREPNFGIGSVMLAVLGATALGIYIAKAALPFSVVTLDRPKLAFAGVTGQTWPGVLQYVLTLGLPVLLYGAGFFVLWRWQVSKSVIFAFPVLFGLALLLVYPLTALDVFLYGAQGWTLAHRGANPLVVSPNAFPGNPFLAWSPFVHRPTSYGPLWVYLSAVAVLIGGGHPLGTLLVFKTIGLASLLASTALCYAVGERVQPGRGAIAAYTLGWNPLALWSTVADGHNDMTMVVLILLGCLFLFDRPLLALLAIAFAGLVKFAAFLLLPVFLLHLLRRRYSVLRLTLWLGIAAACGWLVLRPLWVGSATLDAVTYQLEDMITMSPAATIILWAESFGYSRDAAQAATKHFMHALFAATYVVILLTVNRRIESALAASFCVLFAVLVLATFWFRFWYIVWPLAIAAVLTSTYKPLAAAGITFSGVGPFVYLFTDYLWVWYGTRRRLHDRLMWTVFFPPLLVLCAGAVTYLVRRRRAKLASESDYAEVKPAALT